MVENSCYLAVHEGRKKSNGPYRGRATFKRKKKLRWHTPCWMKLPIKQIESFFARPAVVFLYQMFSIYSEITCNGFLYSRTKRVNDSGNHGCSDELSHVHLQ